MANPRSRPRPRPAGSRTLLAATLVAVVLARSGLATEDRPDPFLDFELPTAWQEEFWASAGVAAILDLEPKALAALVPVQAGFRHCRCPSCDVEETTDPLKWSPAAPEILTCRSCGSTFPNEQVPAKVKDAVPEEVIEVRPGIVHRYPYHSVEPLRQRYPDERIHIHAKRDYEVREFLAKFTLYAALRHRDADEGERDPRWARAAALLLLRFAQVYPDYATHFDHPGQPKFLQAARLAPPYRHGYATGKWDWLGCLDVPINLAVAYAILRDDPALVEAGQVLGEPDPRRTIEEDLFRDSAKFVREQAEEYSESSLYAYRGLIAVGRLLNDPELVHEGVARLDAFARRGFYFDGLWRQGDALPHGRVLGQIDGWIDRLLAGYSDPPGFAPVGGRRFERLPGAAVVSQVALAREARHARLTEVPPADVMLASWPASSDRVESRRPALMGGAGIARLAVGRGPDALDLELRGLGDFDAARSKRLSLRLAVGGRLVLGDLDDDEPRGDGYDRASASHNTAILDGLNQRETLEQARVPAPGSDVRFYAASPDFQVAVLEDRFAYPTLATRYRRFVVVSAGAGTRYAVDLFDIEGGTQHDMLFHGAQGTASHWRLSVPTGPGPESLLPPSIAYVSGAPAAGGRWFIQAYGAFEDLVQGLLNGPAQAMLPGPEQGVRLHLLGDVPATAYLGHEPGGGTSDSRAAERAALILRRRVKGSSGLLSTRSVTLIEPTSAAIAPLEQVGRVQSPPDTIVLLVRSTEGDEHLVLNLTPGTEQTIVLSDGRALRTDGLAVRVRGSELVLAGGTYAEVGATRVRQARIGGTIVHAYRVVGDGAYGAFQTAEPIAEAEDLAGSALLIRHGDGTSRAWTIVRVEPDEAKGSRIDVREEPGFQVHPESGTAHYYQFPRTRHAGPHTFVVARMVRSSGVREPREDSRRISP